MFAGPLNAQQFENDKMYVMHIPTPVQLSAYVLSCLQLRDCTLEYVGWKTSNIVLLLYMEIVFYLFRNCLLVSLTGLVLCQVF